MIFARHLEDRRSLEKFLNRRLSNSWEVSTSWLKDFEEPFKPFIRTSIDIFPRYESETYTSPSRERERKSMIQGNPEITSCEDKSIHGSINPFSKKRKKKRGLTKRVQKNGHPSSRQGDAVLEHLGLACVRGYNGSTGHGEVSGCCPNGWEAYIGGGPRIGHSVVRGLIGRGIRWIS